MRKECISESVVGIRRGENGRQDTGAVVRYLSAVRNTYGAAQGNKQYLCIPRCTVVHVHVIQTMHIGKKDKCLMHVMFVEYFVNFHTRRLSATKDTYIETESPQ